NYIRALVVALAAPAISIAPASISLADGYPFDLATIVVPYSAGGGTDVLGRLLASWLTEETGTTFIVDNVPGGGGAIGVQKVVQSPADGSVLLLATPGPLVVQPLERNDLPYQIDKDLEVISLTWVQPFALITRQD